MPKVTIATFNAENLFARFRFKGKKVGSKRKPWSKNDLAKISKDGWLIDKTKFDVNDEASKRITASAIKAAKADVVALQEIENLDTLRRFNSRYLASKYKYYLLIDSHDPRLIDVAVLSKLPFGSIKTHQFRKKGEVVWVVYTKNGLS